MPTLTPAATSAPIPGIIPVVVLPVRSIVTPVYLKVYDSSVPSYTDYTTEANNPAANDAPLFPDPLDGGDRCYIGSDYKFDQLLVNMGTAGQGTYAAFWQYRGAVTWATLSFLFDSEDELLWFRVSNYMAVYLDVEDDWTKATLDGQSAYWIRLVITVPRVGYVQPVATQIWVHKISGGQIIHTQVI